LYERYAALAEGERNVTFVGRLATYRYYNMDQVVGMALAEFGQARRTSVGASVLGGTCEGSLLEGDPHPSSRLAERSASIRGGSARGRTAAVFVEHGSRRRGAASRATKVAHFNQTIEIAHAAGRLHFDAR
jgi:hypothetical protein